VGTRSGSGGKYGLRQSRLGCSWFTAGDAERIAGRWLARNSRPARPRPSRVYYTLHSERDGKVVGMVSVNASTGAVWYHWWHGRFLRMAE
jgi:hypothetical protein